MNIRPNPLNPSFDAKWSSSWSTQWEPVDEKGEGGIRVMMEGSRNISWALFIQRGLKAKRGAIKILSIEQGFGKWDYDWMCVGEYVSLSALCLSVLLSVCLSVCISVYMSVCLCFSMPLYHAAISRLIQRHADPSLVPFSFFPMSLLIFPSSSSSLSAWHWWRCPRLCHLLSFSSSLWSSSPPHHPLHLCFCISLSIWLSVCLSVNWACVFLSVCLPQTACISVYVCLRVCTVQLVMGTVVTN